MGCVALKVFTATGRVVQLCGGSPKKNKIKCDEKEGEEQEWLSSSLSPVVTLLSQLQTATDRSAAVRLSSLHVIRIHQAQVVRPTLT